MCRDARVGEQPRPQRYVQGRQNVNDIGAGKRKRVKLLSVRGDEGCFFQVQTRVTEPLSSMFCRAGLAPRESTEDITHPGRLKSKPTAIDPFLPSQGCASKYFYGKHSEKARRELFLTLPVLELLNAPLAPVGYVITHHWRF